MDTTHEIGAPTWSGTGTAAPGARSSAEVLATSGLDWKVVTEPAYVVKDGVPEPIAGFRAVVREADRRTLGVVRERFVPVQNTAAFACMDEVLREVGATYEAAGAVDGGRAIWILAKLPGELRVSREDVTAKFILLSNAHDGTAALRVVWTPIRVICQNVLRIALSEAVGEGLSIRHTASALEKLANAKVAFGRAARYFELFEQRAKRLVATPFTDDQMMRLTEKLLPVDQEKPSKRTLATREQLMGLFETGLGHEDIRGTAWAALNAVAELTDQHKRFTDRRGTPAGERRFVNAFFGSGYDLKQRAYELIAHGIPSADPESALTYA